MNGSCWRAVEDSTSSRTRPNNRRISTPGVPMCFTDAETKGLFWCSVPAFCGAD